jgi:ABC-type glycerol-3-phosphate transport system substrate-binding protein
MKRSLLVVAIAALVLVGCGSSGSTSESGAGASSTTTTSKDSGASSAASSIPDSAAMDSLTGDLTNVKAANLVAKCNVLATVVLGSQSGMDNDPAVADSLNGLVVVVRPIDPAVADALAKDAKSAASWCKAKGMSN